MFLRIIIALKTISEVVDVLGFLRSAKRDLRLVPYHPTNSQGISCPSLQRFVRFCGIISILNIYKSLANSISLEELCRKRCGSNASLVRTSHGLKAR